MSSLIDEIMTFLTGNGVSCEKWACGGLEVVRAGICGKSIRKGISLKGSEKEEARIIVPLEIGETNLEEARGKAEGAYGSIMEAKDKTGAYPLIITEDRWRRQRGMMQERLLAHLEIFKRAFARNCEVRKLEKAEARKFLESNHSYGYASCKYHYGLYTKTDNELVAAATFSNARKWVKDGKEIRSYEWTRYASLPGMRISGGMGKLLKAFINEVNPDDIMSYADLEWSDGGVYKALGFVREDNKEAVCFTVNSLSYERKAIKAHCSDDPSCLYFCNFGSAKYRLKLTDYQ